MASTWVGSLRKRRFLSRSPGTNLTIGDWMSENAIEAIRGGTTPPMLGPAAIRTVEDNS